MADAAIAWFVRLQDETASEEAWLSFEQWLQTPAHAAAYAAVERAWVEADDVRETLDASPAGEAPIMAPITPERRARRSRSGGGMSRRAWMAGGAAIAAGVAGVAVFGPQLGGPPVQRFRTVAGETRDIALEDGSRIRLNAASRLTVAVGARSREVLMAEGEASFDVAHDAARPFRVTVGDSQIRVVGTEFNIRRRDGATAVTVRRGVVEVRPVADPTGAATRLAVGEQLIRRDGAAGVEVARVDPAVAFAWTEGQMIYQDAPLAEVAADLGRRFGAPVRIEDAATGHLRFTGVLVTDDLAAVLQRITAYAPVSVRRDGPGFVLYRRASQSQPGSPA